LPVFDVAWLSRVQVRPDDTILNCEPARQRIEGGLTCGGEFERGMPVPGIAGAAISLFIFATWRLFVRARLDRLELAVGLRDLLVRSRATA
jgi:hypothetical protein